MKQKVTAAEKPCRESGLRNRISHELRCISICRISTFRRILFRTDV